MTFEPNWKEMYLELNKKAEEIYFHRQDIFGDETVNGLYSKILSMGRVLKRQSENNHCQGCDTTLRFCDGSICSVCANDLQMPRLEGGGETATGGEFMNCENCGHSYYNHTHDIIAAAGYAPTYCVVPDCGCEAVKLNAKNQAFRQWLEHREICQRCEGDSVSCITGTELRLQYRAEVENARQQTTSAA